MAEQRHCWNQQSFDVAGVIDSRVLSMLECRLGNLSAAKWHMKCDLYAWPGLRVLVKLPIRDRYTERTILVHKKNVLEAISEHIQTNFPGGCPPEPPGFRNITQHSQSLNILTPLYVKNNFYLKRAWLMVTNDCTKILQLVYSYIIFWPTLMWSFGVDLLWMSPTKLALNCS